MTRETTYRPTRRAWVVAAVGLAALAATLAAACSSGAEQEEVDALAQQLQLQEQKAAALASDLALAKAQAAAAAPSTDLEKLKAELKAALAPKTQRLSVVLGEGQVVEEVDGKDVLTGEFHRWEPRDITVNKGDRIILEVTNPRGKVHSLVLKDFGVDTGELTARGGKKTVEFVADKAGTFQYVCGLDPAEQPYKGRAEVCDPDHRRQVGNLIVLER